MSEMIDYKVLSDRMAAYASAETRYEGDCRAFIEDLHKRLITHLKCAADRVVKVPAKGPGNETGAGQVIRIMRGGGYAVLDREAYWRFAFVFHSTFYQVKVTMKVKRLDGQYTVIYGEEGIPATTDEERDKLVTLVLQGLLDWLDYDEFIRGRQKAELGFALP